MEHQLVSVLFIITGRDVLLYNCSMGMICPFSALGPAVLGIRYTYPANHKYPCYNCYATTLKVTKNVVPSSVTTARKHAQRTA